MTGRITAGTVRPLNTATLPGWQGFPLEETLKVRLHLPVTVLNDARAATWGEATLGAGRGLSEFMFITVSTGIGAGLVLGGRLHLSHNGLEGELGFSLTEAGLMGKSAKTYRLPGLVFKKTALEYEASGGALGRFARSRGWQGAAELVKRAEGGDLEAQAAYRRSASAVAQKIADAAVLLGLSRVALGGGVGLRDSYLEGVKASLDALPEVYRVEVVHAALGADAGLLGAAVFVDRSQESVVSRKATPDGSRLLAPPRRV
ncbi:MAG: ROK family protein [Deinococcota bacterium]|nr:ROK family protein [Deinococcota bacterium]